MYQLKSVFFLANLIKKMQLEWKSASGDAKWLKKCFWAFAARKGFGERFSLKTFGIFIEFFFKLEGLQIRSACNKANARLKHTSRKFLEQFFPWRLAVRPTECNLWVESDWEPSRTFQVETCLTNLMQFIFNYLGGICGPVPNWYTCAAILQGVRVESFRRKSLDWGSLAKV